MEVVLSKKKNSLVTIPVISVGHNPGTIEISLKDFQKLLDDVIEFWEQIDPENQELIITQCMTISSLVKNSSNRGVN